MNPNPSPRALLVGIDLPHDRAAPAIEPAPAPDLDLEESTAELEELARGAGASVVEIIRQRRLRPDPATLIGSGKLRELEIAVAGRADLVIFDNELSPTQQRNLEAALGLPVLSRTQLILDIFARHARTREGQLQVELAQLEFLLPRLTGRGIAMSRLGGGIGTRGPGETKLETDRRRIHHRIRTLREALERVRRQRGEQRRLRESVPLDMVALVGYTNAGKSTLFNRLTGAGVLTSARMFATLDPTIRALRLPDRRQILISDTVGFIRNLPHGLINAFRATLEEVTRAGLLLVVMDGSSPHHAAHAAQVQQVLRELNAEATPQIQVWNKCDRLDPEGRRRLPISEPDSAVCVSARTGEGMEALLAMLCRRLPPSRLEEARFRIPQSSQRLLHLVHERGEVLSENHTADWVELRARVPAAVLSTLRPYLTLAPNEQAAPGKEPGMR